MEKEKLEKLDNRIFITTENGENIEGEIMFTFEANGDDIVIYQIKDEAYAAKILEDNTLEPVLEDEWPLIEKIFNEYQESLEDEDE